MESSPSRFNFPLEFIPLAEESNFIVPLGNWILENACTQFRQWLEQGHQLTRLSVKHLQVITTLPG